MWWRDAVIYQVYPRSFQDTDGDGVGDLRGIASRLDHLVELGVDALWLSPVYPSPLADYGYDVSDYTDVDPVYGTLSDLDALVEVAHARGLRVLLDMVPCHTSIEHPWFREHPDWYIWADGRDGGPPNNWVAAFGGSAWTLDEERGRWYLHSFYPEQPDLDWRNPEVVEAMQGVLRFWLARGIDGYRIDAIDRLLKDPELRDDPPASEPFGLPLREHEAKRALSHSRNAPDTGAALARIREAAGDALLVGEVYLPSAKWQPYLEHLDVAFAFELLLARWDAAELRRAIEATVSVKGRAGIGAAWVMSNHDFGRMVSRFGPENARAAAMLLLTLPGVAFLYQGDEIGMGEGPGAQGAKRPVGAEGAAPLDRAGRDRHRHPMQWDPSPAGGFTTGTPWLPLVDPAERNVEDQRRQPGSMLELYRELIALRRRLGPGFRMLGGPPGMVVYQRGDHAVAINTTDTALLAAHAGPAELETQPGALRDGKLGAHAGAVWRD
jgi:alpha-glucosidase